MQVENQIRLTASKIIELKVFSYLCQDAILSKDEFFFDKDKEIFIATLLILSFANKSSAEDVKDCFEGLNRATFAFNQGLDKAIIEPISKGYRKLPMPIRTGTSNIVSNLSNCLKNFL